MRIRQHVNPLKSNFLRIPVQPVAVPQGTEVEVELGSAEAWFLIERAAEDPQRHYVGVEIRRDMVDAANAQCEKLGCLSVRSVFANMTVDLPRLFEPGQVARFFINFPDPWWKARQHKRRVVSPELIAEIHRFLAPSGQVYMATDIFELALDAMAALESETPRRFVNLGEPWTFLRRSPFLARSRRERQCEGDGSRIWRLGYQRA